MRDSPQHQETAGNRMLQRYPSQKRPSGSWSEDKDQCKNQKGSEENSSEQEEVSITVMVRTTFNLKKVG